MVSRGAGRSRAGDSRVPERGMTSSARPPWTVEGWPGRGTRSTTTGPDLLVGACRGAPSKAKPGSTGYTYRAGNRQRGSQLALALALALPPVIRLGVLGPCRAGWVAGSGVQWAEGKRRVQQAGPLLPRGGPPSGRALWECLLACT